jgi:anti-sigma factor RsiW
MIPCRELAKLVGDFLSEELPADQRRRVGEHLNWCPACSADLELHQRVIRLMRGLPDAPVPPRLWERLTTALQDSAAAQAQGSVDPQAAPADGAPPA